MEKINKYKMALKLMHPSTTIFCGPTMSGKTALVLKIIQNSDTIIDPAPQKIVYCYSEYQDIFDRYTSKVEFFKGLPSPDMFTGQLRTLIILDDLMSEVNSNGDTMLLFTRGAHHKNLSVFYLTQNLFFGSKYNRTIHLNAHYIFLFKNPRDASSISYLSRQMFPSKAKFLVDAYMDSTQTPYSYLIVDAKPTTHENLRIRSGLFNEDTIFVYRPK